MILYSYYGLFLLAQTFKVSPPPGTKTSMPMPESRNERLWILFILTTHLTISARITFIFLIFHTTKYLFVQHKCNTILEKIHLLYLQFQKFNKIFSASIRLPTVFTAFRQKLLTFIACRVSSEEDAEDLLQDVFLRFLQTEENVSIEKISAWLYKVTQNRIIDYWRKKHLH